MSITALFAGKLIADPNLRTGASCNPFTLAKVVAPTGRVKTNTWTSNDGSSKLWLSLTADAMLSAYHLKRRRTAVSTDSARQGEGDHP